MYTRMATSPSGEEDTSMDSWGKEGKDLDIKQDDYGRQ